MFLATDDIPLEGPPQIYIEKLLDNMDNHLHQVQMVWNHLEELQSLYFLSGTFVLGSEF